MMRSWDKAIPVAKWEVLITLVALPFLLFPTFFSWGTVLALVALALVWGHVWRQTRVAWPVSPHNGVLVLLAVAVALDALTVPGQVDTLRKLTVLLLGFALFRLVSLYVRRIEHLNWAFAFFFLLAVGSMGLSLFAVQWQQKVPWLSPLVAHFPSPLLRMPETASGYVNPNQLAVVPVIFIPVVMAWFSSRTAVRSHALLSWGLQASLGFALLLLVLTQSRFGWAGGVAGIFTYFLLSRKERVVSRRPLFVFLSVALILTVFVGVLALRWDAFLSALGDIDIANRLEIWGNSLEAVRYFPLTGVGLGSYHRKVPYLIPFATMSLNTGIVWNAHNTLLQVAIDLGVFGVVAYIALFLIAATEAFAVWRMAPQPWRTRAAGVFASLVGVTVYGIGNAVSLGSKPMVMVWLLLGILHQMTQLHSKSSAVPQPCELAIERSGARRVLGLVALFLVVGGLLHTRAWSTLYDLNRSAIALTPKWVSVYRAGGIPHCAPIRSLSADRERLPSLPSLSAEQLTVLGWWQWVDGECDAAGRSWERALRMDARVRAAAWGLIWLGRAETVYRLGTLTPHQVALYAYHQGEFQEAAGRDSQAMAWYVYALNTDPRRYEAAIALDRIYTRQGQDREREAMWRWLQKTLGPDYPGYWWAVGRLAELRQDARAAWQAYERGELLASTKRERRRFAQKRAQLATGYEH